MSGGPVSRDISGASGRMGEGNENLVYPSPWDFKRSLTCCKILRYGTFSLYFPSEGRIFIALKSPTPWQGSNPLSFGQFVSALTSTPPRRLTYGVLARSTIHWHDTNYILHQTCLLFFKLLSSGYFHTQSLGIILTILRYVFQVLKLFKF
jgi:hypothetical protein